MNYLDWKLRPLGLACVVFSFAQSQLILNIKFLDFSFRSARAANFGKLVKGRSAHRTPGLVIARMVTDIRLWSKGLSTGCI